MELSEYTDLRNRYHIMRVLNKKYWPHQVVVKEIGDAERWCYENFKSSQWRNVGKYFAFKHGPDATMFMLRWS
jgi:hypothetical protein